MQDKEVVIAGDQHLRSACDSQGQEHRIFRVTANSRGKGMACLINDVKRRVRTEKRHELMPVRQGYPRIEFGAVDAAIKFGAGLV